MTVEDFANSYLRCEFFGALTLGLDITGRGSSSCAMAKYDGPVYEPWYSQSPQSAPAWTVAPGYHPEGRSEPYIPVRSIYEGWFIRPLVNFEGEDVFACLIMMMPLMEKYVRFQVIKAGDTPAEKFSKGSNIISEVGKLLAIDKDTAFKFWQAFRNGLLHKAVIKDEQMPYILRPENPYKTPVEIVDGALNVYIWVMRDTLVKALTKADKRMWTHDDFGLPKLAILDP